MTERQLRLVRKISGLAILFVLGYMVAGIVRYYL